MRKLFIALILLVMIVLGGCAIHAVSNPEAQTMSKMLDGPLDTVSTITLYAWQGGEEPIDAIFTMLRDIDARMSAVSGKSEIAAISAQAGSSVEVSADIFDLIKRSKVIGYETDGAFDVTIRPVVDLWGVGTERARVPALSELEDALGLVGYEDIVLNEAESSVMLAREGMRLDLGGIAKGYACHRAVEILKQSGVKHGIIDLGGNVFAYGTRPDGTPWRVGVKNPLIGENGPFCVVTVSDRAIVTSGVYERFFEYDGDIYHHIMDPKTGFPPKNGLISVTVICGDSAYADALSTACFVLGPERGLKYIDALPDAEGIFAADDMNVWITKGLENHFRVTDERFRLMSYGEE